MIVYIKAIEIKYTDSYFIVKSTKLKLNFGE